MMRQFYLLLTAGLTLAAPVAGQKFDVKDSTAAPLYTLPEDGTWVDYQFRFKDSKNKEHTGTMRTSSVGKDRINGDSYRWIEFKMAGKSIVTRYGKMLVADQAIIQKQPLAEKVAEAYHQEGDDGEVMRFTGKRLLDYFTMGISGKLKEIQEETVDTKLGKFKVVRVEATGQKGDRALTYRAWLTDQVPYGLIRFEVYENVSGNDRLVFAAEATAQGKGAVSQLDHKKVK